MTKWVYSFSAERAEGTGRDAQPARRQGRQSARNGLARPAGAARLHDHHRSLHLLLRQRQDYPPDLRRRSTRRSPKSAALTGHAFGDADNPLLVSVRSGARASMPGMMDTVLNLGLNDASVETLAETSGDERFAYDSYRRFIQMYSNVVLDVDIHNFEDILEAIQGAARAIRSTPTSPPTTGARSSPTTRPRSRRRPASRSRRTRRSSSGARSAPCSPPG